MTSTSAPHRIKAFDGLRGLAVLMVVVSHVSSYHAELLGPAGVAIFFVLSGFLISSLLLAERDRFGRVSMSDFYARRGLRLFPALVLVVVLTPILLWLVHDPRLHTIVPGLLTTLLYVQDFDSATGHFSVLAHAWSLSVEEQFYFLWPLLLGLIIARTRGDRSRITRVVGGIWLVALVWHVTAIVLVSYDWTYYSPDSNAVFLFTGCLLATAVRSMGRIEVPFPVAAGALAVVCLAPLVLTRIPEADWRPATLLMVPVVLASAPLVLGAARLKVLENPVLRWFGTISYGVYLWNWVLISLEPHGRELTGKERGLAALLAIVAAAGSWYLFERPILRLKSRFQRVATLPAEPGLVEPGLVEPGRVEPAPVAPGPVGPGLVEPGFAEPGYAEPGYAEPGFAEPDYAEPGFARPGFAEPGFAGPVAGVTPTSDTVPIPLSQRPGSPNRGRHSY